MANEVFTVLSAGEARERSPPEGRILLSRVERQDSSVSGRVFNADYAHLGRRLSLVS